MGKKSCCIDLRPNPSLIDPYFEGYKLSLEKIPIHRHRIPEGVHTVLPDDEQFSFKHVKLFTLHNHLYPNYYNPKNVYFVDKDCSVKKISWPSTSPEIILQKVVQLPSVQLPPKGNFNVSILFASPDLAVIGRGNGVLHLAEIKEVDSNEVWTLLSIDKCLNEDRSFVLLDAQTVNDAGSKILHIVFLQIEERTDKEVEGDKQGLFLTKLKWRTLIQSDSQSWKEKCVRELEVHGNVNYVALEKSCKSLYIISDKTPQWVYDSENPIKNEPEEMTSSKPEKVYSWSQSSDSITMWLHFPQEYSKTDVKVKVEDLSLEVEVKGELLLNGRMFNRVDKDLTVWNCEKNQLEIQLTKHECGLMWSTLLVDDDRGEEILNPEVVADIHEKLAHLCSDKEENPAASPFTTSQLEDCDVATCETTALVRLDARSHRKTHEASLSSCQWLFGVRRDAQRTPAICCRHDVDACVWQFDEAEEDEAGQWPHEHVSTFSAFGYVQASKTQRKFLASPPDLSYVVICEASRHIFVYRQPSPLASELKNRRTGKRVNSVAKQQLANLDSGEQVLGVYATNEVLYVLLESSVCALNMSMAV